MKRALFCLIAFTPLAQAKMQFMSCKTAGSETVFKKVEGNVDREAGKVGTLMLTAMVKGKVKEGDQVNAREIKYVKSAEGDKLVSEWMHQLSLTLPASEDANGRLDLDSQSGLVEHGAIQCTFKDEDAERLEGRELCYQHVRYCREFKRFPKANEKDIFLAGAKEFEKKDPGAAFRRVVTCTGTHKLTKSDFKIMGSLNDERFLIGTFVIEATRGPGLIDYRVYRKPELTFEWDEDAKGMKIQTEASESFVLLYKKDASELMLRGEDYGIKQSFSGPVGCTVKRVSREELASHEQCLNNYLGCEALKSLRGPGMLKPEDLDDLRAMHKQAISVLSRQAKP